jgi:cation diffusion facilitator family transporter
MTDVWTTLGVLVGVGAVQLTGWLPLDPIIALLVALNIVWAGVQLMRRAATGLMDSAIPVPERERVESVFARFEPQGVEFHSLRTRQAGQRRFISVHVLVPGEWSVQRGHDLLEQIEREVRETMPGPTTVMTHLEPVEDPVSHEDKDIDR